MYCIVAEPRWTQLLSVSLTLWGVLLSTLIYLRKTVFLVDIYILYFLTHAITMMNCDHEDYNNASINAFVYKHAVNIKRAYARTKLGYRLHVIVPMETFGCASFVRFWGLAKEADMAIIKKSRALCFRLLTCVCVEYCQNQNCPLRCCVYC